MPSVANPNKPSSNRLAARSSKAKKIQRQRVEAAQHKISKQDVARGARPGLLPSSGPNRKLSAKKARKMEKKMGYALKRRMEAEGIVSMQEDAPEPETEEKKKKTTTTTEEEEENDVDIQ
ncbi:hypothetical protein GMORB2_1697 [Geosmithia morbida]|uniref:Ribosome biogenesis protein ALB1 n=1 Tax=Geosmithia morbida TaxID=1094350 RepID=A0A9P4YSS5_9HYPO|nr:uncharacterized protein GMORB2_1697 [Geosmithia morbida]KAF4121857.1 hypothetical protein GMORB2_1697 [Geosmithia morbida]